MELPCNCTIEYCIHKQHAENMKLLQEDIQQANRNIQQMNQPISIDSAQEATKDTNNEIAR